MKRIFITMLFLASAVSGLQACDSIKRCFGCCSTKSNKVQPAPQAAAQAQAPVQHTRQVFRSGSPEFQASLEQAVLKIEAQRLQRRLGAGVQQYGVVNINSSHTVYNYPSASSAQTMEPAEERKAPGARPLVSAAAATRSVGAGAVNDQPDAAPLPAHSRTASHDPHAGSRPTTPGAIGLTESNVTSKVTAVTALDIMQTRNRVLGVAEFELG